MVNPTLISLRHTFWTLASCNVIKIRVLLVTLSNVKSLLNLVIKQILFFEFVLIAILIIIGIIIWKIEKMSINSLHPYVYYRTKIFVLSLNRKTSTLIILNVDHLLFDTNSQKNPHFSCYIIFKLAGLKFVVILFYWKHVNYILLTGS